jgi:hypothetical protein
MLRPCTPRPSRPVPTASPPAASDSRSSSRSTPLADPVRLIDILGQATDDAVRRLGNAFGLDDVQAEAVMDLQVHRGTPAHRARIADELRVLRSDWGPPVEAEVRFTGRRSAVLVVDGAEHSFRAGGVSGVLQEIGAFVSEEIAVPRLRSVTATIGGLPDGPIRMTCTPARNGRFEYADEPVVPDDEG